jgi:NADH:ubiquinone oxidoreductase subunit 5 (subunit L)/multisubunit Na+/H+ antiporter MnhA subunit
MELHPFPALALIPLLPLLGAVYCGLLGWLFQRRFGRAAVHLPAVLLPVLSFVLAVWGFLTLASLPGEQTGLYASLWKWLAVGPLEVDMAFVMDRLSSVMCLVVTGVGSLIHIYSMGYMAKDQAYWRYFSYLNLFMFAMLVLVLGDSFLTMFIGWEGVGLCSYLLIAFWYTDREKAAAGMKAFVVNRVGDAGFVLGMAMLFWVLAGSGQRDPQPRAEVPTAPAAARLSGTDSPATHDAQHLATLTFREVERRVAEPAFQEQTASIRVLGIDWVTLVCLLLFLGAAGKSAQLPLYVWLPDAMAGPTPVSALIHAATMVTAGVYMVARLHFLFGLSPVAMTVVATVGALTALFAASIGLFQYDIKKVLAYSTISQLGFMFLAVGVGAYWVGIFHLVTHAFFKACLFLGSGSVILGCHHEQDMRQMGGLRRLMPITAMTYLLACCAIAGFPFFSGFFSKDEILWKVFDTGDVLLPGGGLILWAIAATAALGTALYMFRSYYLTFSGAYRGHAHPAESPRSMTWVLGALGVLSVVGGFVGLPQLWRLPNLFEEWLAPVFHPTERLLHSAGHGAEVQWGLMGISVAVALAGFLAARSLYKDAASSIPARLLESRNPLVRGVHGLVFHKYFVDELYRATFIAATLQSSRMLSWFDRNVVDGAVNLSGWIARVLAAIDGLIDTYVVDGLVNAVAEALTRSGATLRRLQTGQVQGYIILTMAGAIALVVLGYLIQ